MPWKVIFENSQKISSLKKWKKKFGENQQGNQKQCEIQITIFLHSLYFSLSVCINSLFGKILEREIFQLKAGTHTLAWVGPDPGPYPNCPINMRQAPKKDVWRCKSHCFDVVNP